MKRIICILAGFAVIAWTSALAQSPADSLKQGSLRLLARTSPDSVTLRWGTVSARAWLGGNASGYIVERAELTEDEIKFLRLTPAPLKPWTPEQWKPWLNADRPFAGIAAQALHGESFELKSTDTGSMVRMRNQASELSNRWGFALLAADIDPVAAEGLALRYVDRTVRAGRHYIYRVFAAADAPDSSYVPAGAVADLPVPEPADLRAEGRDGAILLSWEGGGEYSPFSGYYLERAEGDGVFKRITKTPVLSLDVGDPRDTTISQRDRLRPRYLDTGLVNNQSYQYRVRGIIPFGDVSGPGDVVKARPVNTDPPLAPDMYSIEQTGDHRIMLKWTYDASEVSRLKGFMVLRSVSYLNGYRPLTDALLSPETREYTDNTALADTTNFYQVVAVGLEGRTTSSISRYGQIADTTPPAPPTGLAGTVDTNGVVRLHWPANPEPDVRGYRVYRSNSVEAGYEFIDITGHPIADTAFTDTIVVKTLTKDVFYRLIAEDRNFNRSEFSPVVKLMRPDLIAPIRPIFTGVIAGDSMVSLEWTPSSSEDVKSHILMRRKGNATDWAVIGGPMGRQSNSYIDRDVQVNVRYEYTIVAVDSGGLRSPEAMPAVAIPYDNGRRPEVTNVRIIADTAAHRIVVKWEYPVNEKLRFIIYRSRGGAPISQYESVAGTVREYVESDAISAGEYLYGVRAFFDDGGESALSESVGVVMGEWHRR